MQLGSRGAVIFPSSQQVQGRAMMGDQENLIFTAQNVIDWPIIYFFKACICYFSLFLKDKCISSLVRTKYIEKRFTLQLFFLPTVSWTFILSWATMRYLPCWNFLFSKNNCMCNWDNAHDVAACPDEWSTKRSEPNKSSTNQDKHCEKSSNFCYTLNPWEHMSLNIKLYEIFF